jgi:hypothetical protein
MLIVLIVMRLLPGNRDVACNRLPHCSILYRHLHIGRRADAVKIRFWFD